MRVDASTGLMVGVKQVLSPFFDERPSDVVPDLVVLHGISLPPGEFGGPWIARLFTGNLPADAHPEFRERAALRVSAHLLTAATASSCSSFRSGIAPGTPAYPRGRGVRPAMTIRSASNAKGPTRFRTSLRNIRLCARSCQCC